MDHDSPVAVGLKRNLDGLDLGGRGSENSDWWVVSLLAAFSKNFGGMLFARSAIAGHTEFRLQLPEIAHTGLRRGADLLVSDGIADTDVHVFNDLEASGHLTANANDCQ